MEGYENLEEVRYADSLLPYSYPADCCCEAKPCKHQESFNSGVIERPFVPALDGSSNFLAVYDGDASSSQSIATAKHLLLSPILHAIEPPALGTYTPGYLAQDHVHFDPYNAYTDPTPTNTINSIYEEDFDFTFHINCIDFLGLGLPEIQLTVESKYESLTRNLVEKVKQRGFKAAFTNIEQSSIETALEAIHTSICYHHQHTQSRLPLTIDQLRTLLLRQRQVNTSTEFPSSSALAMLLDQCYLQTGGPFNMGVIEPLPNVGDFRVQIYCSRDKNAAETIWLFHNVPFGKLQSQWQAIIPDFNAAEISYAAALLAPKSLPYSPSSTPPGSLLRPPDKTFLRADSTGRTLAPSRTSRRRSSSVSRSANQRAIRVSRRQSKPSSECGSYICCNKCKKPLENQSELKQHQKKCEEAQKNHACNSCEARFQYPKDLKRHLNTHNGVERFICDLCPKEYSRKDNLQRHVRDHHTR